MENGSITLVPQSQRDISIGFKSSAEKKALRQTNVFDYYNNIFTNEDRLSFLKGESNRQKERG